jgi:hypothetical protein
MATVIVLSADATQQLFNATVVSGTVDVNGDLILQKADGSSVNLGNVKEHGQLLGLLDDDHPQYAMADGSRGDFATEQQGLKADAARPNLNSTTQIEGGSGGVVETFTIHDDNTSTSSWVNRWVFQFLEASVGAVARATTHLNEYGELRVAPAKYNTVAARFFTKIFPNNPTTARDMTVPVVELMDDRTTRTSLRGWLGDGTLTRKGIKMSECVVLGLNEAVPAGLPANTVIVRKTS